MVGVSVPENFEQSINDIYAGVRRNMCWILKTLKNNEYIWLKDHPYIKVPYVLGSPVICALTYRNEEILYKDGIIHDGEVKSISQDWKILENEGILSIYKTLYELYMNGSI